MNLALEDRSESFLTTSQVSASHASDFFRDSEGEQYKSTTSCLCEDVVSQRTGICKRFSTQGTSTRLHDTMYSIVNIQFI